MHERLTETFRSLGVDYEIIFVNDASPDDAREVLAELAAPRPARGRRQPHAELRLAERVHERDAHRDRRRRGPARRRSAGPAGADRRVPREVARGLRRRLRRSACSATRRCSCRSPTRPSTACSGRRRTSPIPLDAGDFSLIDRRVVDALNALPERDRFIRGLRAWVGFRQTGVPYVRPERMFGTSTNSLVRNLAWARRGDPLVLVRAARPDRVAGVRHGRRSRSSRRWRRSCFGSSIPRSRRRASRRCSSSSSSSAGSSSSASRSSARTSRTSTTRSSAGRRTSSRASLNAPEPRRR